MSDLVTVIGPSTTLTQAWVGTTHLLSSVPVVLAPSSGALLVANRLSEFDTTQMKVDARSSLELEHIDCGVFL
jgi:hypothetical protein